MFLDFLFPAIKDVPEGSDDVDIFIFKRLLYPRCREATAPLISHSSCAFLPEVTEGYIRENGVHQNGRYHQCPSKCNRNR